MSNLAEHSLHARALAWAQSFCAQVLGEWDATAIESLHQLLDGLVIEAEARGEEGLSAAALELSTALCAFVGNVPPPGQGQRRTLLELTDQMMFASADDAEPDDVGEVVLLDPSSRPSDLPARLTHGLVEEASPPDSEAFPFDPAAQAWCVSGDPGLVQRLARAFASLDTRFSALPPNLGWTETLPDSGVLCVVVDADSLGVLLDLQRRASGGSASHVTRPTFVAVLKDASTGERMRALRAGADHVIRASEDPGALAARLGAILAGRSQEAVSVVVIDDDASQTLFCAGILRRVGVQVVCSNDAASAMQVLRQELPDVVLVDLHMPEVDGLELAGQLLELAGAEFVSVLFLSGDDDPDARFDALAAGADDYLSKPIQPRHLIRAVLAHGKRSQRRRRAAARGRADSPG